MGPLRDQIHFANVKTNTFLKDSFTKSLLSSGFVQVTSKSARLYFFSFHVCCVVIVLKYVVMFFVLPTVSYAIFEYLYITLRDSLM